MVLTSPTKKVYAKYYCISSMTLGCHFLLCLAPCTEHEGLELIGEDRRFRYPDIFKILHCAEDILIDEYGQRETNFFRQANRNCLAASNLIVYHKSAADFRRKCLRFRGIGNEEIGRARV